PAAEGLGQVLPFFGGEARQRRCEVVAQREPALVVEEREHALVGAVEVGQELAQRLGVFERGRLQALEPPLFIDSAHRGDDALLGGGGRAKLVDEAARLFRRRAGGWGLAHGEATFKTEPTGRTKARASMSREAIARRRRDVPGEHLVSQLLDIPSELAVAI